jgi:hypothetical protein
MIELRAKGWCVYHGRWIGIHSERAPLFERRGSFDVFFQLRAARGHK